MTKQKQPTFAAFKNASVTAFVLSQGTTKEGGNWLKVVALFKNKEGKIKYDKFTLFTDWATKLTINDYCSAKGNYNVKIEEYNDNIFLNQTINISAKTKYHQLKKIDPTVEMVELATEWLQNQTDNIKE